MPNPHKTDLVQTIRDRFGELKKISSGNSLFRVGEDAARIYFRYSKVHKSGRTFFGLRKIDLRQLEGFNSYICFLRDDSSAPLFVPYADFEEVFREAKPAADGQYKVQLISGDNELQLYVARQGRFNVEAYMGTEVLERSLINHSLSRKLELSHAQVQTLLGAIGHLKGFSVCIPTCDVGKLDWSLTNPFSVQYNLPPLFTEIISVLSEVDVIWLNPHQSAIEALFEVEHTTTIYSGLLRFNDVLLTDPRISNFSIVADENRRSVFSKQLFRPTFRKSGLSELTSFMEYANVFDWHRRLVSATENVTARKAGTS